MLQKISFLFLIALISGNSFARLSLAGSFLKSKERADYQLGDEWGKKSVTQAIFNKESSAFKKTASATAYLPIGGTGFYLGKLGGMHVIATNHHVCAVSRDCIGQQAEFKVINKKYRMRKFITTITGVDLTLIGIDIPTKDEELMSQYVLKFSHHDIRKGQKLLTMGFGFAGNPRNSIMANQDSDCKVFSHAKEYRFLADPDDINPLDYKVWSFAHGCDISHGDSGSAMVDRDSGDVVGILWTGRIPKSPVVQQSANLEQIYKNSSEDIWNELSYAAPSVKIYELLALALKEGKIKQEYKAVIEALVRN